MSSTFLSGKKLKITNSRPIHKRKNKSWWKSMCTSGRGDLRHSPETREQKNTLFFSSELHYADKVNLLSSKKVLSLDSRSKLLSMLARQPGFRFLVEIFHSKLFFQKKRKEKKNVTLLLWYCGKCWRRCGEIAPGGVVVVVETPRRKWSARSTSGDDDNSRRWAFRPGKAQYYCPSSSSSSSCSSTSCPHRSSTQQLILSSVSVSCNNQEANIYYQSIIKKLGSVQIIFIIFIIFIKNCEGGTWVGWRPSISFFFFLAIFNIKTDKKFNAKVKCFLRFLIAKI